MKTKIALLLVLCIVAMSGCSFNLAAPVFNVIDPQKIDVKQMTKKGESCITRFLFFTAGDRSVKLAADNAGISKIDLIEYRASWWLFGSSDCVVVYGH